MIDWLMREATKGRKNGIHWTPWTQLEDMGFAYDLGLLSHTQEQMQTKASVYHHISESLGLRIHHKKSEVLGINTF